MKWSYWIKLYTQTHCVARGLRPLTIAAYEAALRQFQEYTHVTLNARPPDAITARDVLEYVQHLRQDRGNGDSAINRTVTILKSFYRAMVAMGYLETPDNPMAAFPSVKAARKKLPVTFNDREIETLLALPPADTVLGLRDRAILALLYGTGIRASECASLCEADVDLAGCTVTVTGKGGHERCVPLNERVVQALSLYRHHRGLATPRAPFFLSRRRRSLSRGAIYERVRTCGHRARISKRASPHRLRHTFATHLVKAGVNIVTIRDLLGHKQISSTQVYLHVTAEDLRSAADKHPIGRLLKTIDHLLPDVRLPVQYAPRRREYG
jgi:site-specific recombinase XerD